MPPSRKKHKKLPPRMIVRTYKNKKGETWIGYYYEYPRDANGKRKVIPLGDDFAEAKKKWGEIEGCAVPAPQKTLRWIYTQYMIWAVTPESGLSPRTRRDRESYWRALGPVFGDTDPDDLRPGHMMQYYDRRSSKISAKKELRFISVLYNWGIGRGYIDTSNPVTGITRQMRVPEKRDIYVTDDEFYLVYKHSTGVIRDALDIAYLTGQRPADVKKMRWDHIKNGQLHVTQNKTGAKLKINVVGELATVLNRIKSRGLVSMMILSDPHGNPLTDDGYFRYHFHKARASAAAEAKERGIPFRPFQFRDLRPKNATDMQNIKKAQDLLGHTTEKMTRQVYIREAEGKEVDPLMAKSLFAKRKKKQVGN